MASLVGQIIDGQIIVDVWMSMPVIEQQTNYDPIWLPSKALIDTGATISGAFHLATAGLIYSAKNRGEIAPPTWMSVSTPSGEDENPAYNVDVALGIQSQSTYRHINRSETNWIYHTLEVVVIHTEQESTYDVLLGMNFLQYCHLSMYGSFFILSN